MTSTDVAMTGDYDTGLEDLNASDLAVPRVKIDHRNGVFVNSMSGEQYPELVCIVLGMVRQRVLWHHNVEDEDKPMCKSPDFRSGFAFLKPSKSNKSFPFGAAGFDLKDLNLQEDQEWVQLPCDSCKLKDWGSHPMGEKPYCSEQWTLPILFASSEAELDAGNFQAALISMQKSGIPPSKQYLGSFKTSKTPAYAAKTRITLDVHTRGQVTYSKPKYQRIGDTDQSYWSDFSEQYRTVREFLTTSSPVDTEGGVSDDTTTITQVDLPVTEPTPVAQPIAQPVATPQPAPAQQMPARIIATPPAPAAAPVAATPVEALPDDDLPF